MRWDEREYEWFELWHDGSQRLGNFAVVCKFRGDDAIVVFSLPDQRVRITSPDYAVVQAELWESEFLPVKGRQVADELPE